jgi:hypothetical protein
VPGSIAAATKGTSSVPSIHEAGSTAAAAVGPPSVTDWQPPLTQQLAKSSVESSTGRRGGSSSTAGSEAAGTGQVVLQLRLRPSIFLLPVLPPEHQLAWLWSLLMLFMDMVYVAFIMPTNMVRDGKDLRC